MSFTLNNLHVQMRTFAMFQKNYMIVLEMADNLGVRVGRKSGKCFAIFASFWAP